jgi:hypothetical protein
MWKQHITSKGKDMKNILFCISIFFSSIAYSAPKIIEYETEKYIQTFQSQNMQEQKVIAQKLEWSGLSDSKLFDLIEEKLLARYTTSIDKAEIDYLSWLAKALAFSGQKKYASTLNQVFTETQSEKLKKYTQIAIQKLPLYTEWNKIIVNEKIWDENLSGDINRFTAMIESKIPSLHKLAAKRIHFQRLYDIGLLNSLEKEILKNYQNPDINIDSFSWMCKALAGSRNINYKNTIQLVSSSATNISVAERAKKYLRYFN